MSFLSEFEKIYGNGLKEFGFTKLKGTNIFGKLVNGEILLYLTYKENKSYFSIRTGVQTIYSFSLSKEQLDLSSIGLYSYHVFYKKEMDRFVDLDSFCYDKDSLQDVLELSLKKSKEIVLKPMNQVCDLESYIDFCKKTHVDFLKFSDKMYRDSILLIKTNNHDTFNDLYEDVISGVMNNSVFSSEEQILAIKNEIKKSIFEDIVESRDRVYGNQVLYEQVFEELKIRKNKNMALLQSYGLLF